MNSEVQNFVTISCTLNLSNMQQELMKKSASPEKVLEANMKAILLNHLKSKKKLHFGDTVINELTLDNFSRRVDLSIIYDEKLVGFEIKSKNDSLLRLEGQVEKYLMHFDKVVIFSDQRHTKKILDTVPKSVGVWELNDKGVTVKQRGNTKKITDKKNLLKMMTAHELRKLASNQKLRTPSKTRAGLEHSLLALSAHTIRESTILSLKSRFKVTSMLFWKNTTDKVTAHDIKTLSPYSSNSLKKQNKDNSVFKSVLEEIIEDGAI